MDRRSSNVMLLLLVALFAVSWVSGFFIAQDITARFHCDALGFPDYDLTVETGIIKCKAANGVTFVPTYQKE